MRTYNIDMDDSYEKNYLNKRPQDLCLMCGKCCRVVTTGTSHEELCELARKNDVYAKEFLEIFVPYESVEAARKVDAETVDNIFNHLQNDQKSTENLTFYYCKYLQDDNKCGRYEDRKTLCKHFPSSPWAIVPPGCGFSGWLFLKREQDKERVRKAKEELLDLLVLRTKVINKETLEKLALVEKKLHKTIELYKKYGSQDW